MINKPISKSKKSYFRKSFQENHSKSKIIWTKINEIIQSKIREHEDHIQMNIVSFLKKLILMKFTKYLKIWVQKKQLIFLIFLLNWLQWQLIL